MDNLPLKKAKLLAEIVNIQKHAKVQAVQKNRGALHERHAREAEERVAKLRGEIEEIDAQITAQKA